MAHDDCRALGPEITALLDGELAGPAASAVEAHLRACPSCAALARDLADVGRTLRSWDAEDPAPPVTPGFRARLLARTGAERRAPASRPSPAPASAPGRILRLLPAAAAAAVLLAAGFLGGALSAARAPDAGAAPVPGTLASAPRTAAGHLAEAARHAAAGRPDLERRSVLAAWATDPSDPRVRAARDRVLGFDPDALEVPLPVFPGAPAPAETAGAPAPAPAEPGPGDLWIGPWRFGTPGACDAFLGYRDRAREIEIAQAAREASADPGPRTVAAPRAAAAAPHPLSSLVASLRVGSPVGGEGSASQAGMVVYPLRFPGGAPPSPAPSVADAMNLPGALAARRAEVQEAPGRSASTVLVSNLDGTRPLLLLAGEVLDGGRADRMVARDLVVPPGARRVPVAVVPVEAGRESDHPYGTRFRSVAGVAGARLRGLALGQAAPEEIDGFLRARLDILDVTGLRRSLSDAYSDRLAAAPVLRSLRPRVAEILRGLQGEDVVGFAVAHGHELLALEVFGSHALLAREAPRLLEGCALEAATYAPGGRPPSREEVAAVLEASARGSAFEGAGEWPEVGVLSREGGLLGSGVAHRGRVLHASVVRGAGSGALAGRGSKSTDFPGGSGPPEGASGGEGGPGAPAEGGSSGGASAPPDTAGGGGESRPSDPPPTEKDR